MSHIARLLLGRGSAPLVSALLMVGPTPSAAQAGDASLEALAEAAVRAVVLIDVETPSDTRQGSGFLVDPTGVILSNYHVVRDARGARVKLSSGDVYDRVSILAQDERRDIAVLRVAGFDLPTLPLGNSDSVRIGSSVVMIGSPLGLENTVSTGVVSGRRQEPEGFQLLQITAPASQGSSGGAVLSADGEVVGIAVSQLSAGQNLNFAVPINYARGLLQQLPQEPLAVLQPTAGRAEPGTAQPRTATNRVNPGLAFDLADLRGYIAEYVAELGEGMTRRSRVTYRVIETVGSTPARIERYLESETTRRTGPFGTSETVRRERVRSLVASVGLRPLSSRGELSWWTQEGWRQAEHDVRFEGDRVIGVVTDSAGRGLELDRTLPQGVLLRDVRDLAFATLVVDSLVGRSVEFTTFDPRTGEVGGDRYDVLGVDTIDVAGARRAVLRVNVATGLTNETVLFLRQRPRIAVQRLGIEELTRLDVQRAAGAEGPRAPLGTGVAGRREVRARWTAWSTGICEPFPQGDGVMQSLTRGPVAAGLALAAAVALSPTGGSAQSNAQQPAPRPQQQACTAEVTPSQVAAGQQAVRLTVTLSQDVGEIRSIQGAASGIAVAQPTDLPRTELAAGGQQPRPIAMGTGRNTWTVWVNTSSARAGTHDVTFVANSSCSGEVTVTAAGPAR